MILSIKTNRQYSKSFLRAIRRNLEREILININFMKLLEYSQELGIFFKEEIDCYKAVKQAIRSFKIISEPSCINFLLPSKVRLLGTKLSLSEIISIMEYGALDLKPYPLIRNSVKSIEDNLDTYYNKYLRFGW